ncbi:DEP domain-containing mTOR-interacting protein-like isoform X2 [Engystomops pustulosus]|uniref:DEP domain-containing mTOR-interacting protein-like isoform X2 n=1 Tax=Engystomops pustulosus TaxID=76066 RepID=UPI003AFB4A97
MMLNQGETPEPAKTDETPEPAKTDETPADDVGEEDRVELLSSSLQESAEDFQRLTEIRLTGEQLRLRLHNSKLIRDRCQQTLTYPNCFVAKDVVDWLIEHKEATDRENAIKIMQKLLESKVFHHVCDEHPDFKDEKLFYRFRNDDGTLSPSKQMRVVVRSQRIYEKIVAEEDCILKVWEQGTERYRRTIQGSQLLDWMLKNHEIPTRKDGELLCRSMVECGIIQPVRGCHHFSDSDLLYRFAINFRRKRKLVEVLGDISPYKERQQDSPDSPFCLRKLSAELPNNSFACADEPSPSPPSPVPKRSSQGGTGSYQPLKKEPMSPPSVLKRPVTVEELTAPGAPFMMKILHIRQFVKSINGLDCLYLHYRSIYKHIVAGPRALIVEVLEPLDDSLVPT